MSDENDQESEELGLQEVGRAIALHNHCLLCLRVNVLRTIPAPGAILVLQNGQGQEPKLAEPVFWWPQLLEIALERMDARSQSSALFGILFEIAMRANENVLAERITKLSNDLGKLSEIRNKIAHGIYSLRSAQYKTEVHRIGITFSRDFSISTKKGTGHKGLAYVENSIFDPTSAEGGDLLKRFTKDSSDFMTETREVVSALRSRIGWAESNLHSGYLDEDTTTVDDE